MADQLHANKAKFTGPGTYKNEIIAVYLGKTALEDSYMGLGTVVINSDKHSGTFLLNDKSAAGHFDCGAPPAFPDQTSATSIGYKGFAIAIFFRQFLIYEIGTSTFAFQLWIV